MSDSMNGHNGTTGHTPETHAWKLAERWANDARWQGVSRPYSADDVLRLRGTVVIEHTLARLGAERLWHLLHTEDYVPALGALTGNQAVQQVKAGLKAIYLSGWQVAADANLAGQMYPDQSLYPANSVPAVVKRINQALQRADQIDHCEGSDDTYWFAPIVADAEAGFGGPLNVFELMKCDDRGGRRRRPLRGSALLREEVRPHGRQGARADRDAIRNLIAARLAADVMGVPTLLIARTDANGANLLTSDIDERDHPFLTGERTPRGLLPRARRARPGHRPRPGLRALRRHRLVRDRRAEHRGGPPLRRRHPRALPRQAAGLQLLALLQLEEEARATTPSPPSSSSLARWATSSSSSRWPASTP